MTDKIFVRLGVELSVKMKNQPVAAKPFDVKFSLDIRRSLNVSVIKGMAQDSAELAPFKEWFGGLEQGAGYVKKFSSSSIIDANKKIDGAYFQEKFSRMGPIVERLMQQNLLNFVKEPSNASLGYKVQWHIGGYLTSKRLANTLCTSFWLK